MTIKTALGEVEVFFAKKRLCTAFIYPKAIYIFTHNTQRVIDIDDDTRCSSAAEAVADYIAPLIRRRVRAMSQLADEIKSELDQELPEP